MHRKKVTQPRSRISVLTSIIKARKGMKAVVWISGNTSNAYAQEAISVNRQMRSAMTGKCGPNVQYNAPARFLRQSQLTGTPKKTATVRIAETVDFRASRSPG